MGEGRGKISAFVQAEEAVGGKCVKKMTHCKIEDFLKYGSFFFLVQLQELCTFAQMQSQKHMLFLNESFCFPLQIHTVPSTLYAH